MTAWDRVQRMDLELRQQRANVDQLSDEVERMRAVIHELTEQRDLARRVAMRLEEENALLAGASPVCAICLGVVTPVKVTGVTS